MAKEKKASATKPATTKPSKSKSKDATAPVAGPSSIDTDLAARNAAAMVGRGGGATDANPSDKSRPESAAFKQLKESFGKPVMGTGTSGVFGQANSQKKSGPTGGPLKQTGRNQTFGADASRAFVPRRTGGG